MLMRYSANIPRLRPSDNAEETRRFLQSYDRVGKSPIIRRDTISCSQRVTMKILFVADCRSPIAQNWIRHFATRGDEIYLASTFACPAGVDFPIRGLEVVPVAF